MNHNKGIVPNSTRKGSGIHVVTNQLPCLKESSGMVSLSIIKQYKENDKCKQWC